MHIINMIKGGFMNYKELSQISGLPQKAIRRLQKKAVINDPPTEEQLYVVMVALAKVWGDEELIRLQLANHNTSRRAKIVFGSGFNRWERTIIHRILGHYSDREDNKFNLHVSQIVDEAMHYNRLPETMRKTVTDTTYMLRRKVNNMRYRNITLKEIADSLINGKKPQSKVAKTSCQRSYADQIKQNDILGLN